MRAPRGAAGGSGNEPPSGFRAGDRLRCLVLESAPGGYCVNIINGDLPGFMKTNAAIELGAEVEAQFVCVHRGQSLLAPIYSQSNHLNWSEVISEET